MAQLKQRFGAQAALIDSAIAATGRPLEALRYLPLLGRKKAGPCSLTGKAPSRWDSCRWIRFDANTLKQSSNYSFNSYLRPFYMG